ncbi:MAG: DNA recombination protein RmuC [Bryobacterales bacterium]|nr:DNA recombination protein RmuC [Bryobacterales bacterium]
MEMMVAFVTLLLGIALGAFLVWFSKEGQTQQAVAAAQAENLALIASLESKAASQTQRESELSQELAGARHEAEQRRLQAENEIGLNRQEIARLREEQAQLQAQLFTERQISSEKQRLLTELEERFTQAIGSASHQAIEAASREAFTSISEKLIEGSSKNFLEMAKTALAEYRPELPANSFTNGHAGSDGLSTNDGAQFIEMVKPLDDTLRKVEDQLRMMEQERSSEFHALLEHVKELGENQSALRVEAGRLANAMRTPVQSGLWGQVQLRRVVEMAGMLEHCEFPARNIPVSESDDTVEMPTADRLLENYHPDHETSAKPAASLTVHLPGARSVSVYSDVPVDAYLAAIAATDDGTRNAKMGLHAASLRTHVEELSNTLANNSREDAPDFVVSFLPGEAFLSAALVEDPGLLEYSLRKRVLLTTPTTLMSLLKTASFGWRQEDVAENARQLQQLGRDIFDRLRILTGHFNGIKHGIEATVRAYNDAATCMESRVLAAARRFEELGAVENGVLPSPQSANVSARGIPMPGLRALAEVSNAGESPAAMREALRA